MESTSPCVNIHLPQTFFWSKNKSTVRKTRLLSLVRAGVQMNVPLVLFGNINQFLIRHYFMWATCLKCKIYTAWALHYLPIIHVNSFLSFTVLHLTAKSSVCYIYSDFCRTTGIKQSLESLTKKGKMCFFAMCVLFFIFIKPHVFWTCFCIALHLMWSFTTAQSFDLSIFLRVVFFGFKGYMLCRSVEDWVLSVNLEAGTPVNYLPFFVILMTPFSSKI